MTGKDSAHSINNSDIMFILDGQVHHINRILFYPTHLRFLHDKHPYLSDKDIAIIFKLVTEEVNKPRDYTGYTIVVVTLSEQVPTWMDDSGLAPWMEVHRGRPRYDLKYTKEEAKHMYSGFSAPTPPTRLVKVRKQ